MDTITLLRPPGMHVSPAYSQVAVIPPSATTIHVGGQNAVDAAGALVGGDDVAAQVRQAMANVATALDAAGASLADVVSWFILIVEHADLQAAYGAAGPLLARDGDPPLVTAAKVAGLGVPGALIELSAIAAVVR
jgi:enamine deaminase RidA (YjgF/YER057c/UK114 family)